MIYTLQHSGYKGPITDIPDQQARWTLAAEYDLCVLQGYTPDQLELHICYEPRIKKKIVQPMLSTVFKINVKICNVSSINCVVPENTHAPILVWKGRDRFILTKYPVENGDTPSDILP